MPIINTVHSSFAVSKSTSAKPVLAEKSKVAQTLTAVGQSHGMAPIVSQGGGEHDFSPMAHLAHCIYSWSEASGAPFEQQEYQEVKAVLQQLNERNPELLNTLPPQQHSVLQKFLTAASFCTNPVGTLLDQLPWHHLKATGDSAGTVLKLMTKAARLGPVTKILKLPKVAQHTLSPLHAVGKTLNLTIGGPASVLATLPAPLVGNIVISALSMVDLAQRIIAANELLDSSQAPHGEVYESVEKYIYMLENEYIHQMTSALGLPGVIYSVGSKLVRSYRHRHNTPWLPANTTGHETARHRHTTTLLAAARNEAHPERDLATCAIAMIMGYGNAEVGGRKAGAVIRTADFISARDALKLYFPMHASDKPGAFDMFKEPNLLNTAMLLHAQY